MRLFILGLILASCASGSEPKAPPHFDEDMSDLEEQIRPWAVSCEFEGLVYPCEDRPQGKEDQKDDHVVIFAGLLCASGEPGMHEVVRASVGDDGSFWRSPRQLGEGRPPGRQDRYSRDNLVSLLLCAAYEKDQDLLWRTYRYLRENNNKLCPDDSDGRCRMTPVTWRGYEIAFKHAGMKVPPTLKKLAGGSDLLAAQTRVTRKGYQTHLNSIQIHLHNLVGKDTSALRDAKRFLVKRENLNPYFEWLLNGPTEKVYRLLREQCPTERPPYADEWTWGQDQDKQKWKESIGWDCLFLINLIKK